MTPPLRGDPAAGSAPAQTTTAGRVVLHVSEAVVAVVAAQAAAGVPGVRALRPAGILRPGRGEAITGLTARLRPGRLAEVTVTDDGTCRIALDIEVQLGAAIPEVARAVQRHVDGRVLEATGLRSVVSVDVVGVGPPPGAGAPPGPPADLGSVAPDHPPPAVTAVGSTAVGSTAVGSTTVGSTTAGPVSESAAVGRLLVDVVAAHPGVRVWVAPPFDRLPQFRGRPPAGVELGADRVGVHLAVATADVVHLPAVLGPQLVAVLAGTSYQHAAIHLYADHPDIDDAT